MFKSHHSKILLVVVVLGIIGVGYYWRKTYNKIRIIQISREELDAALNQI